MSTNIKNEYFVSPDLSLCATLCCLGYQIEKINKIGERAYFSIRKDDKIDDLIQRFFNHKLEVDALGFFNALKELKTRIYNVD